MVQNMAEDRVHFRCFPNQTDPTSELSNTLLPGTVSGVGSRLMMGTVDVIFWGKKSRSVYFLGFEHRL